MSSLLDDESAQSQLIVRVHENRVDAAAGFINPPHRCQWNGEGRMMIGKMKVKFEVIPRQNPFQAQGGPAGDGEIQDPSIPDQATLFVARTRTFDDESRTYRLIH